MVTININININKDLSSHLSLVNALRTFIAMQVQHSAYIIIIISAHKSDLSNPWSQTQASFSIPSLHPKTQTKEEKERKK